METDLDSTTVRVMITGNLRLSEITRGAKDIDLEFATESIDKGSRKFIKKSRDRYLFAG